MLFPREARVLICSRVYDPYYTPHLSNIKVKPLDRRNTYEVRVNTVGSNNVVPRYTAVLHRLGVIFPKFQNFKDCLRQISCAAHYLNDLLMLTLKGL